MYLKICLFLVFTLGFTRLNACESTPFSIDQNAMSSHAESLEGKQSELASLELINLRALEFFSLGQFENALADFNHILHGLYDIHKLNDRLFGTALWGRLLCHAYAGLEEETFEDLAFIRSYYIDSSYYSYQPTDIKYASEDFDYKISFVADFANPGERLSPSECEDRVRGTASAMRLLTTKIPNRILAEAVIFTITELEYAALGCCNRAHWTKCLTPIVDSWNYLKMCMDKGVSIAPKLASPGR